MPNVRSLLNADTYEKSFFCRKIINAMIVLVLGIEKKQNGVEDEYDMKTG